MKRSDFTLFQSHLDLAHQYWEKAISKGDIVIDATCGNGIDTLFLCKLTLEDTAGQVYALDIQASAISKTKDLLTSHLPKEQLLRITCLEGSHHCFPDVIRNNSVKLIVYNLGYLPGGDKSLTTQTQSTLESLASAQDLLKPGGLISITCYPGHPEGKNEEDALLAYTQQLSPKNWSCCHQRWVNRKLSPSLLLIQKALF